MHALNNAGKKDCINAYQFTKNIKPKSKVCLFFWNKINLIHTFLCFLLNGITFGVLYFPNDCLHDNSINHEFFILQWKIRSNRQCLSQRKRIYTHASLTSNCVNATVAINQSINRSFKFRVAPMFIIWILASWIENVNINMHCDRIDFRCC